MQLELPTLVKLLTCISICRTGPYTEVKVSRYALVRLTANGGSDRPNFSESRCNTVHEDSAPHNPMRYVTKPIVGSQGQLHGKQITAAGTIFERRPGNTVLRKLREQHSQEHQNIDKRQCLVSLQFNQSSQNVDEETKDFHSE
ncbi:hypothetical protein UY3_03673 [Chelonia mydas]|uniref:Uncharacterized protein n=1 Tax=Chelonia mydas TaxID=8469 RepID=M7BPB4_CHEMY|nr:hypothetical protein UY3_03673 [Chelonia mydas]